MQKIIKKYKKTSVFLSLISLYLISLFVLRIDSIDSYKVEKGDYKKQQANFKYEEKDGIKILYLQSGESYSRGYFHGKELSGEIKDLISYFKNNLLKKDKYLGRPIYSLLNHKAKGFVKYIPEEYIAEMKGIADGAGVKFNDVLLINTYDDLLNLAGCSSMVIPIKSGFNSEFYHTRNLDYNLKILAKNKIVLKYDTHISIGFPGYIGVLTGIGEKGISLSSHTSYADNKPDYGIPTGLLYRKILEESSKMEDAKNIIEKADRTIANNIMLGSYKENSGIVAEVTNEKVGYRKILKEIGVIVATNYFLSDELFNKRKTFGSDRYFQYINKLKNLKKVDYDSVKNIVSYYDKNIRGWGTIANRGTVQSVIMLPQKRTIFIANGSTQPVTQGEFIKIIY